MKKVLIFDGTNTFLRNFVVNPHSDSNGIPIGGLVGTLRSVKYMIRETGADRVLFVWDGAGGAQRRRGIVADYKMGRKPRLNREVEEGVKDSGDNMHYQKSKLKSLLGFLGVTQIEIENIEADDTIGYLVGLLDPTPKVVVSSDRDMWQFVSDTTVVYWPTKKVYITKETFHEHSPILPANFVLTRALGNGDSSDNIKGIKGLGEKTLLKLFPMLPTVPVDLKFIMDECKGQVVNNPDGLKGIKRWYKVILENEELVRTNLSVMQLTEPQISASAAAIIRNAASMKPSFNVSGFKLALLNNSIQLVESDMFATFQEYKLRAEHA
jgi:5'-3' exonuclease